MVSCTWVQDNLMDYPQFVQSDEKKLIAEHLLQCHECQQEYALYCAFSSALTETTAAAPSSLRQNLLQRFRVEKTRRRFALWSLAAAALLLIATTFSLSRNIEEHKRPVENRVQMVEVNSIAPNGGTVRVHTDSPFSNSEYIYRQNPVQQDIDHYAVQISTFTYDPEKSPEGGFVKID